LDLIPYTVKLNEGKEYVIIKHKGDLTLSNLKMARTDIRFVLPHINTNKILVDVFEVNPLIAFVELFTFISETKNQFSEDVRIAVLANKSKYKSHIEYVERLIHTHGFDMRFFRDKGHAVDWLLRKGMASV